MRIWPFSVLIFLLFLPVVFAACPPACPDYQCGGYVHPGTYYGCFVGSGETQSWYVNLSSYRRVNISASLSMSADDNLDLFLYDPSLNLVDRSINLNPGAPEQVSFCGKNGTWTVGVYSASVSGGYASYSITISAINQECCDDSDCNVGEVCKNGQCVFQCYPDGVRCGNDSECCSGICNERCCKSACPSDDFACSGSSVVYRDYYCNSNGDCAFNEYTQSISKPDSQGFIRDWLILGPFRDVDCGCGTCYSSNMQNYGCDQWFDFSSASPVGGTKTAGQTWFIHHNNDDLINFETEVFGSGVVKDDVTAFAFAYVYSPEDRNVQLAVGSDDGITVWLNGNIVVNNPQACRSVGTDQDVANVHLNQGVNRILVRVGENTGDWGFRLRFKFLNGTPVTDVNISIPSNSNNCESFNGWVSYTFSDNDCCRLNNFTYYASYVCSGKSCIQTASSSSTTTIRGINNGLACGSSYCSGAYGYNRTCFNGNCNPFLILNCTDEYACTYDACTGAASSCYHCVQEGYRNSTSGCNYPCCSGLSLKSCPTGNVCCPSATYSEWYYTSCKRFRYVYSYDCPTTEGGSCPYTTTTEYENINEGKICKIGEYECKDGCEKGKKIYTCQSGECLVSNRWAGLVGYWKLDEGSGTIAYDSSGLNNNGTLTSGLESFGWTNECKFGRCIRFNGTGYVLVQDSSSLNDMSEITIEAWVKLKKLPSEVGSTTNILYKSTSGAPYEPYWFYISSSNRIGGTVANQTAYRFWLGGSTPLSKDVWYHVAFVYDGSTLRLYLNGNLESLGFAKGKIYISNLPLRIGIGSGDRIIDEVKIYNYALSDEEIKKEYLEGASSNIASCSPFSCRNGTSNSYPLRQGTVGYWKLDEGSGTVAYDSSGLNNRGTVYGATWARGVANSGLEFDGINDYVEIEDSPSLDMAGSSQFTMEAWVNLTQKKSDWYDHILNKEYSYEFAILPNLHIGWAISTTERSWYWVDTGSSIRIGEWTHIAITYDGNQVKTYKNGKLVHSLSYSGQLRDWSSKLTIGWRQNRCSNCPFNGVIDEVRIINRSLTEEEIRKDFESTAPFAYCSRTCRANCGADPSCDNLNPGSYCGFSTICNETCNCVIDCSIFGENSCPAPYCKWCSGTNECKRASEVECQPGECNGNVQYCSNECKWTYCPGTNAECYCESGTCRPCIGGTCVSFICQLACPPGECSITSPPFCIPEGQCWEAYICVGGSLVEHKGDGVCNCGETSLDTPQDCSRYHVYLYRGWNLISVPYKTISAIESDTCNSEDLPFYHWNNANKKWETVYGVTNLKFGEAYWVNPQWHLGKEYIPLYEGCYINISASNPGSLSDLPELTAGYNQIGSIDSTISFPTGNCQISAGPFYWDPLNKRWTKTNYMVPGQGYWIYTSNNCRLS